MTIAAYTRNVVPVSACQYTGSNKTELRDWGVTYTDAYGMGLMITPSEGEPVLCNVGDYVVRETADKDFSVVPQATFEADYTVVP